ncbi:MAG: PD40 domain-containing protein [Gemmatimonadaceae bacterium]|nr:PD40 domain-containing protein [Gemmatimonadaceae bacterium]
MGAQSARAAFSEPALSPDGSEIAFVSGGDIWTVPAAGGTARLLISDPATESRPLYSPDGSRLAFVSTRTGNGDIYVLTFATGALERITYSDGMDQLDAWSRDGAWLYFSTTSQDISGMSDVLRVSARGGTPMPVTADRYASEYWAAPSPDGATVAFTAPGIVAAQWWRKGHSHLDESEIWLLHRGRERRYEAVTSGGAKSAWPMWSADGRTLYYMSDRTGAENVWAAPLGNGSAAHPITTFRDGRVLWPTIAADGRTIAFERNLAIWTLDVASGRAREVPIVLRGVAAGPGIEHLRLTAGFQDLALSPDGKKLAFVAHGEVFAAPARLAGANGAGDAPSASDAVRITHTAAAEAQPVWSPDSRRLAYTSDRDGPTHLFVYDVATETERRLTNTDRGDVTPQWSPDGRSIAFIRGGEELRVIDVASGAERRLATGALDRAPLLSPTPFAWSPDGGWIAYLTRSDGAFENVYLVPSAGGASRPVSFLPSAFARSIAWARDRSYLLFTTSQRTEMGRVARVDLVSRVTRFREDEFRDLFHEESPRPAPSRAPSAADSTPRAASDSGGAPRGRRAPTRVDFDGIRERLSFLPAGIDVLEATISPDGKSALLTALAAGRSNLYLYPLDNDASDDNVAPVARQLTATPGPKRDAQFSPDGKSVYYLDGGRISIVSVESRQVKPLPVVAELDVDFAQEKFEVFHEAWRFLADNFFDPAFNGVDWRAMEAAYEPYIAGARTPDEVRRITSLMIGELNASHSGINRAPRDGSTTGRIGLRFDPDEYERTGRLRIAEVIPHSPAALHPVVQVGRYLIAVNGTPIGAHTNLDALLDHTVDRRVELTLSLDPSGPSREVVAVRPVSTAAEKALLYRAWVEQNRAYVARVSGGRLGYVHMFDMSQAALDRLYTDLDVENRGRDGVVIDVRNNNGGFVNAYALDVLSRQPYLVMTTRGRSPVSARSQLGQRALELPTILVTNQHSLSDAEDFTQGYRALGLGKVVGEPTAGWIVYTFNVPLIDGSVVRIPSTRVTTADGAPMEMHPRPVDIPVTRPIGASYTGSDPQLDAAVRELLAELARRGRPAVGAGKAR